MCHIFIIVIFTHEFRRILEKTKLGLSCPSSFEYPQMSRIRRENKLAHDCQIIKLIIVFIKLLKENSANNIKS